MDKIEELLTRGVANIIPNKKELEIILRSEKKLNIYLGIDPTATEIHLGNAVALRKLEKFARLGHNVTFLIGDFTALIGDTSDKDTERPVLTEKQIQENFKTYKNQAQKILDFSKVKIAYNSQWLKELSFTDIVRLTQKFSAGDFISRELIKKRLNSGKRVGLHEFLYPVMQGYDSYVLDTDIQIGGTDQIFNMQAGRTLQKILRKKESFIISNVFLEGTDGRKMSKSWGNAIWLDDKPQDMYAKIMAIDDNLIVQYFTLGTNVEIKKIKIIKREIKSGKNPMEIKKELARIIVTELHSEKEAIGARENFEKTVQKKETPEDIPVFEYSGDKQTNIVDLLIRLHLAKSRSSAKQLVEQRGVYIDEKTIDKTNSQITITNGMKVRVGKRKFIRIRITP